MLIRRTALVLGAALVSVVGVLTLVFVLVRFTGDPAELMAPPNAPPEQIAQTRVQLGLDRPLLSQYGRFLADTARGDLGKSYYWRTDARHLVMSHLGPTLALAGSASAFALLLGVPAGMLAALFSGRHIDRALVVGALIGQAIPAFWMAPVLILFVGVDLGLTPTSGMVGWRSFILPTIALGSFQLAVLFRITRAASLEVLSQDHVRLARAKGSSTARLARAHVLPSTALPVMTVAGLALASLIGGSVIVERIFAWPGIGNLMIQAVDERDFPVVQAVAVIYAVAFVGINSIVDLLYAVADPRLRKELRS
jgi:peptide/nickel transport system permease protein